MSSALKALLVVTCTVVVSVGCDNLSLEFGDRGRPLVESAQAVQKATVVAPTVTPVRRFPIIIETRTPDPFGRPYHRAPVVSPTVISRAGLAVASSGAPCEIGVIDRPVADIERLLAETPGRLNHEKIGGFASGKSFKTVSAGQDGFKAYAEFTLLVLRASGLPDEQRRKIEGHIHDCIQAIR